MNSKVYKWCAVPECRNTSIKTPDKLFVFVPQKKTIRDKWLKLAERDSTGILPSTHLYFCEDHFDMPNDMENYMEYHLMGSVSQIRMKPGCLPTKFQCQTDLRKGASDATERPFNRKKRRKTLIEVEIEECTVDPKQLELGGTSSGSLVSQACTDHIPQVDAHKTVDKSIQVRIRNNLRNKSTQTKVNVVNQMTSPMRTFCECTAPLKMKGGITVKPISTLQIPSRNQSFVNLFTQQ